MTADYHRVEAALRYLEERWPEHPSLDDVAKHIGLSPFHFQRLFHRWAGITPHRFMQHLTWSFARARLQQDVPVLQAAWEGGLSGASRLHDLALRLEAVTPGQMRSGGASLPIRWGVHESPFGRCFVATTPRGLCQLGFVSEDPGGTSFEELRATLARTFPQAQLTEDAGATAPLVARVFRAPPPRGLGEDRPLLPLFVSASPFQLQVWRALLAIPEGAVTTYQAIARAIGNPGATRAVGTAVGRNPIAWLIPCHRVIRSEGHTGQYRWGPLRKRAMLAWEAARTSPEEPARGAAPERLVRSAPP